MHETYPSPTLTLTLTLTLDLAATLTLTSTPTQGLRWEQLQPEAPAGVALAPASSLAAVFLVDAHVCVFGGFNTMTEADLGALHLLALCPEASDAGAARAGGAGGTGGEAGLDEGLSLEVDV